MASPDVTPYVDLTVYDATLEQLKARAVLAITTKFPGFVLVAGSTEDTLLDAFCLAVAEDVFSINRLTGGIAEVMARLFGVERSLGVPATATATFQLADTLGHTIPAGTRLRLALDGGGFLVFTTDSPLVIPAASSSGTVAITATSNTDAGNGTPIGTALALIDSIATANSVVLATAVTDGADPEGVADWLSRATTFYRTITQVLVRDFQFAAFALTDPAVFRARAVDRWDPGTSTFVGGHMTVAVMAAGGTPLSSGAKTALQTEMDDRAASNLAVHVVDPTVTAVPVTATVVRHAGFDDATVQANVTAALAAYLDPDAWEWGATVYRNELITVIDAAEGVDRVVTIAAPAADVALPGVAPLADLGATAITVQAPA